MQQNAEKAQAGRHLPHLPPVSPTGQGRNEFGGKERHPWLLDTLSYVLQDVVHWDFETTMSHFDLRLVCFSLSQSPEIDTELTRTRLLRRLMNEEALARLLDLPEPVLGVCV